MLLRTLVSGLDGVTVVGESDCEITQVAPLRDAQHGALSFFSEARYLPDLKQTAASAVILQVDDCCHLPRSVVAVVVEKPALVFAEIVEKYFTEPLPEPGINAAAIIHTSAIVHPTAHIGPGCIIGAGVTIGAGSVLLSNVTVSEGVSIGERCYFYPQVVVCGKSRIGNRVILHPGAVVGSDGFGLVPMLVGWRKMPQVGSVCLEDEVEVGANTTIDRGALADTHIETGVKIDNQVQIAHNVRIGKHTVIAGCTGIAGSTVIGAYCTIAGGVCISGHLSIADKVVITGMSMVTNSIKAAGVYSSGTGLQSNHSWLRSVVCFRNLYSLVKKVKKLESLLNARDSR